MTTKALVLFSGGQDSTTCLAWALAQFDEVHVIGFDYGQRHKVELDWRERLLIDMSQIKPAWGVKLKECESHTFKIPTLNTISQSALTRDIEFKMQANGLPNTFTPGRNIVFLTFASMVAYRLGIDNIVGGMCQNDYGGYPDCREKFLMTMNIAINMGMDKEFDFHFPVLHKSKAETWQMAYELGGKPFVELIKEKTHTCYRGDRGSRFVWGYGCGDCPACKEREKGYHAWGAQAAE